MSDDNMHAPINDMQIAEDIHLTFNHMMMSIFHRIVVNKKMRKAIFVAFDGTINIRKTKSTFKI
ncbi:hypothetical protein [Lactococcus lactis]|uniref:hypothetical protein n=1 Tax=Lactococcus lactis TaxID=1358 RepID=UPI0038D14BC5